MSTSELGIIRQYLVSLGFDTDTASLGKAQGALTSMAKTVTGFTSSLEGMALLGGVTAAIGGMAAVLDHFTLGVANAALQNEMFARQMWMNYDSAVAFKSSLDALHVSIQDLYLSPQLMNTFIQFRQLAKEMQTPVDYQSVMAGLMGITFQFDQFKLEMTYGVQWIGYYLAKDLSGPLGDFQNGLQKLNTWIIQNMPEWTAKVASFIAKIATVFVDIYKAGKSFVDWWDNLGSKWQHVIEISAGLVIGIMAIGKAITIVMGIAATMADANLPLLAISAALLGIILLVQDFMTYQAGGQSALGGLWAWVDKMANSPEIKALETSFSNLKDAIADVAAAVGDLFSTASLGTATTWAKGINDAIFALTATVNLLVAALTEAAGLTEILAGLHEYGKSGEIGGTPQEAAQGQYMMAQGWELMKQGVSGLVKNDAAIPFPGKASGGPASGPTIVGEKGPELLNLPGGSQVFSNAVLGNMLNAFSRMTAPPPTTNKTTQITISPTINIKSTDPVQAGKEVKLNVLSLTMRAQQGVIA